MSSSVQVNKVVESVPSPSDIHFVTFLRIVNEHLDSAYAHRGAKTYAKGHVWSTQLQIDGLNCLLEISYHTDFLKHKILRILVHHSGNTVTADVDTHDSVYIDIFRSEECYDASKPEKIRELWDLMVQLRNYKVCPFYRKLISQDEFDKKWQADVAMRAFIQGYTTECSVCYTLTKTHTDCGHPLCIHCWQKFRDMNKIECPCCRQETLHLMSKSPCMHFIGEYVDFDHFDYCNGECCSDDEDQNEEEDDDE